MKLRHGVVLILASAFAPACAIIGSHSYTDVSGTPISERTLEQIKIGDDQDYVLALLGQPTTKTSVGENGELWKYAYHKTETRQGRVLLLVSSKSTTETEETVFVRFDDGQVSRYWRG